MRYLVTVSTEKIAGAYTGSVQSPTFLLDSHIQGITDSAHAERIVRQWLKEAGLIVDSISVEIAWDHTKDESPVEKFRAQLPAMAESIRIIMDGPPVVDFGYPPETPEIEAARVALRMCEECRMVFDNQAGLDKHFHDGPAGSRKHLVFNVRWAKQLLELSPHKMKWGAERLLADCEEALRKWDSEW